MQPNSSAASIKRRSAISSAPARSSGGNPQTSSAILGIAATADLRKAFSSSAGAKPVNAQLIGQLQVVHRRYRVEHVGVLEVCGEIPRASNTHYSMIYAGKICFRTSINAVGAVKFGLWLASSS